MTATALILVDLQTGAFDGRRLPPIDDGDRLLKNARALLEEARASRIPVVHVQHCARPGDVFAPDAPGWPIAAPVAPRGGELVVQKRASDAFEGTDLHRKLQEIGARQILVTGIQTEHCVAATCRGALRLGYGVDLAEDGHSTWPDERRSAREIMAAEGAALEAAGVALRSTADILQWIKGVGVDTRQLTHVPIMKTGMLIRRPAAEVFTAFVDPDITTKFWFTRSSGRLEPGKQVQWDWEMYGISIQVTAKVIEPNRRIVIEWPGARGATSVEWTFAAQPDGATFVGVTETGFTGDGEELVKQVTDSTQGFSLVLAGLKAFLEHGVRLNLVADRYPAGIAEH